MSINPIPHPKEWRQYGVIHTFFAVLWRTVENIFKFVTVMWIVNNTIHVPHEWQDRLLFTAFVFAMFAQDWFELTCTKEDFTDEEFER